MNSADYIEAVKAFESPMNEISGISAVSVNTKEARLLHAAMGMVTEAGEFMDAMKKLVAYGKPLDDVNLCEELGDMLWYIAVAMDALATDFPTEMRRNIAKLAKRYPNKFEKVRALCRDLVAERKALEAGLWDGQDPYDRLGTP